MIRTDIGESFIVSVINYFRSKIVELLWGCENG